MKKTFCDICREEIGDCEIRYSISSVEEQVFKGLNFLDVCGKCYLQIHDFIEKLRKE